VEDDTVKYLPLECISLFVSSWQYLWMRTCII